MKVFIVFLGLFIINVSFLSYQGDMGRYVRCQTFLKAVAEECAAGAALYYDENEYSEGGFRFNYAEGRKYIDDILKKSQNAMPLPQNSAIVYEVTFRDDHLGYDASAESGHIPSVTVELTASTPDLFHLPFLEVTKIKRAAKYELPQ